MPRSLASAAAVLALATTVAAPTLAAPVTWSSLPTTSLMGPPSYGEQPRAVGRSARVAGVFTAKTPRRRHGHGRWLGLFGNEADAKDYAKGGSGRLGGTVIDALAAKAVALLPGMPDGPSLPRLAPTPCFQVQHLYKGQNNTEPWNPSFQERPTLYLPSPSDGGSRQSPVYAVHREHFTRDAAGAAIDWRDVWVDVRSGGVKSWREGRVKLRHVATGPHEVQVYAARGADGAVHYVVTRPQFGRDAKGRSHFETNASRHMSIQMSRRGGSSDCGHARVGLKTVRGGGEQAIVRFDVVLGSEAIPPPKTGPNTRTLVVGRMGRREVRVRNLGVHLSASQSASESEPVVSVRFAYRGAERRQMAF